MYLIVGSTPQSGWQRLLPAFESVGCTVADPQQVEEWCRAALEGGFKPDNEGAGASLDGHLKNSASELLNKMASPAIFPVNEPRYLPVLQAWLEEFPDTHLLLFYSRPESVLAEAMEQGDDPQKVLNQWHQGAEQLMNVHRRNRRRSLLIDVEAAIADPEGFFSACKKRYGLKSSKLSDLDRSEKAPIGEIYKLIAAQFVAQTPGLPELLAETEASALPLAVPAALPVVDCIVAHEEFQQMKQQDVEKENELLVLQLDQIQEELRCYQVKCQEESEKWEKAEQNVKEIQEIKDQIEEQLQDVEKENELVLLQLHQVQEELETYYLRAQEEGEKREKAERNLAQTEKRLNQVLQSTSWKMTTPIRAFVLMFKVPLRKLTKGAQKATG